MNADSVSARSIRLRDRLRAETRAAILAAAEHDFAARGISRARMEAIAARAGVAVGTLYNYFEDRDALLRALVEERRVGLLRRLDAALGEGAQAPFEAALAGLLGALFEHWAEHRGLLSVLLQEDAAGVTGPGKATLLDELARRIEKMLRRGRARRRLRPDPAGLQAALLLGMVRGVLRRDARLPPGAPAGDRAAQVMDLFLRGAGR
jgi:AcrR family transcriptional regulator